MHLSFDPNFTVEFEALFQKNWAGLLPIRPAENIFGQNAQTQQ